MCQKLNSTVPNVFQHNRFMSYSHHTYETRHYLSIRTPLFKLQISMNSIFENGINIWNNLFPEIKSITNKSKCKNFGRICICHLIYVRFFKLIFYAFQHDLYIKA